MNNRNNGDHVSVNIREMAKSIEGKVKTLSALPFGDGSCIHRVQEKLRKVNEDAYTPEKVSIGPFHRGKEKLKAMENQKLRYVRDILRSTNPIEALLESIKELEERSRKCYSEPINLSSNDFVEMMVIDGLFIIELFRKNQNKNLRERDDPIFNTVWGMAGLMRDFILLENQIPMFVLESLFKQIKKPSPDKESSSLPEIALLFFKPLIPKSKQIGKEAVKSKHLLDFLAKTLHPSSPINNKSDSGFLLHCVTDLRRAGMKFKKETCITSTSTFLDITYKNGVLKIPEIVVQDQTETLLRNLIAFEQSCDGSTTFITSYAFLMDSLINSGNDVRILRRNKVICNYMGDDEDVSKLFNNLCNEVSLANYCHSDICHKMNDYYNKPWHYWLASWRRNYFRSPWTIISLLGAILLLVLTLLQTIFTIIN